MVSLITNKHIELGTTARGKLLRLKVSGPALVCFATNDTNYKAIQGTLNTVARSRPTGAKILLANISKYPQIVQLSRQTTTLISASPTIMFFNSGAPYAINKQACNIQNIQHFVESVMQNIRSQEGALQSHVASPSTPLDSTQGQSGGYSAAAAMMNRQMQQPIQGSTIEADDDPNLKMPDDITSYNEPWKVQ
jgi:hypothetical protein